MGKVIFAGGKAGMTVPGSRLPKGYTELACIESSGTQYIDTGFKANSNTRLVMDVEITDNSAVVWLFGGRNSSSSCSFNVAVTSGTAFRSDFGAENKSVTVSNTKLRTIIDKNKNACAFGSTTLSHTNATFTGSYNLTLFATNTAGTVATNRASAKLYSCQIYDNGTLVRDFVPCLSDADGVGLYDLVNNVFYANAGSGTFTGSEVA